MGLISDARLDAKAFRENTVYNSGGDPIRLGANADRLDLYADALEKLRGYAQHPVWCVHNPRWAVTDDCCRCGLTALLHEIGD